MWRTTRADSRCFPHKAGPLLSIQADFENRCWGAKTKVKFIANSCVVNKTVLSAVLNGSLCTLASPCWINLSRQDVLVLLASPETLFTEQFNYSPVLTDVFCLHLWGVFFLLEGLSRHRPAQCQVLFPLVLASLLQVDFELLSSMAKLISVTLIN